MEMYENILHDKPERPIVHKLSIEKRIKSKYNISPSPEITYANYVSNKLNLAKCKIPELKSAAKRHKLHISGNKGLLVERLTNYYNQTKSVIKIQSVYRMWLNVHCERLRGPGLKNRSECVNETDFSTLEPINEIPREKFFSYRDANKFIYGFDITSLMELMTHNVSFKNPYNREVFSSATKHAIISLYKINCILLPEFKEETIQYAQVANRADTRANQYRSARQVIHRLNVRINPIQTVEMFNQYDHITRMRDRPISSRITQLFMAMDRLGNYTNISWFESLDLRGYIRLYRYLYDIWYIRSGLAYETRSLICPYGCPFDGIFTNRTLYSDLTYEQIKMACVIVFENLVYSGVTDEYKTLGAFYSLSALTIVSLDARAAMPWLYEAVM